MASTAKPGRRRWVMGYLRIAAALAVLLVGLAMPRAGAAMTNPLTCCVCTNCPSPICVAGGLGCELPCMDQACTGGTFFSVPCSSIVACPQFSPAAPALGGPGLTAAAVMLILLGMYQIHRRRSFIVRAVILIAIT